jgi:hypothetical protein
MGLADRSSHKPQDITEARTAGAPPPPDAATVQVLPSDLHRTRLASLVCCDNPSRQPSSPARAGATARCGGRLPQVREGFVPAPERAALHTRGRAHHQVRAGELTHYRCRASAQARPGPPPLPAWHEHHGADRPLVCVAQSYGQGATRMVVLPSRSARAAADLCPCASAACSAWRSPAPVARMPSRRRAAAPAAVRAAAAAVCVAVLHIRAAADHVARWLRLQLCGVGARVDALARGVRAHADAADAGGARPQPGGLPTVAVHGQPSGLDVPAVRARRRALTQPTGAGESAQDFLTSGAMLMTARWLSARAVSRQTADLASRPACGSVCVHGCCLGR